MRGNITLDAGVVVGKPSSTDIAAGFKDCMVDNVAHLREAVLKLVGHQQTREAGANGKHLELLWRVGKLGAELEGIINGAIVSCVGIGSPPQPVQVVGDLR